MKKLKSWRWQRLFSADAFGTNPILLALSFLYIFSAFFCREYQWVVAGLVLCAVLTLFVLIREICQAYDCFYVKLGAQRYKAYVYPSPYVLRIEMVEESCEHKALLNVAEYEYDFLKPSESFIYRMPDDDEWYLVGGRFGDAVCLGKRLGKTIFMPIYENPDYTCLNVLSEGDITRIKAERAVVGTYFIPPFKPKKENISGCDDVQDKTPDDYLIVRGYDGNYTVYGIFINNEDKLLLPLCRPVYVPSIIIREFNDTVILVYADGKYKELCRKQDTKRKLNDVIIELTDNYRIGGIIWKYDASEQNLVKLYEGNFFGIGFENGEIIGENGWKYIP